MSDKILTGNRLEDGVVIYLSASGAWVEDINGAHVVSEPQEVATLEEFGKVAEKAQFVVGAYLIDVRKEGTNGSTKLFPIRYREQIRAFGPSIHPEFGRADEQPEHFQHRDDVSPVYMNGVG